jgi:hypothetical protein
MSKKIEIPLEGKIIKSIPVKFPDKCVYCGALKQKIIPQTIKRHYSYKLKLSNTPINGEYEMDPIDIPYCEKHFNEIKALNAKNEKIAGYVQYPLIVISALVNLLLFYKPLYNWFMDTPKATYIPKFGPVATGFGSVMLIIFGPSVILIVVISQIGEKILERILKPPYGLRISAFGNLLFDFKNEQIVEEFLAMNQDLNARIPIKPTLKEIAKEFKEIAKKDMEEARKTKKKGK